MKRGIVKNPKWVVGMGGDGKAMGGGGRGTRSRSRREERGRERKQEEGKDGETVKKGGGYET